MLWEEETVEMIMTYRTALCAGNVLFKCWQHFAARRPACRIGSNITSNVLCSGEVLFKIAPPQHFPPRRREPYSLPFWSWRRLSSRPSAAVRRCAAPRAEAPRR